MSRATGIPKIIEAMARNGSPPAEFEFDEDHSYFMVRLPIHPAALEVAESAVGETTSPAGPESRPELEGEWRFRPEWRAEWVLESIHHRIMVAIAHVPLGRSEIAHALGHKSVSGAAKQAIVDLLEAGLIEYTFPGKPNSRLQKYRRIQNKMVA